MKDDKLTKEESRILNELLKASKALQAYTLLKRSHLESSRFLMHIKKLENKELIKTSGITVEITTKGFERASLQKKKKEDKPWRRPLPEHLGEKQSYMSLYIPRRSLLSQDFHSSTKNDTF